MAYYHSVKLSVLRILTLLFSAFHAVCFGQTQLLSANQQSILNTFIETLLKHSEAGYVILKQKPICVEGFFFKDPLPVNSPAHRKSTALREGAQIWRNLGDIESDTILHICDHQDPLIPGHIHILVISKPLFHEVVNKNLPLFQYVLGPTVSSHGLLEALLTNQQTLYSLLKGDKALIGIVLGYGTQNSLFISRMENLQETLEDATLPFQSNALIKQEFSQEFLPFSLSFGFKTVNDELNSFQKQTSTSSHQLINELPQFIFGWVETSADSRKFISKIEESQQIIKNSLLSLPLERVLQKLGKKDDLAQSKFDNTFSTDINELIAREMWEVMQQYDSDFFPYFLEGLEKRESHGVSDRLARFPEYRRSFLQAKANLQEADNFFEELDQNPDFYSLVQSKLYARTINKGDEATKCEGPFVCLSYSIFCPEGLCLATAANVKVNLKNTIPGFAMGIKGMQIGETREIYIHPALAYAHDSSVDKHIYLKAVVRLQDIYDNDGFALEIRPIDLQVITSDNQLKIIESNYKQAIIEKAVILANYLARSEDLDLLKITGHLKTYHVNRHVQHPLQLTQRERDLVNQVHWRIYYSAPK